ncbi:MAG: hypothetical protein BWK80_22035 [Desulfobacteraceae bacterium IS3]|jgi:hypothetical protein|nr:MAG: hypothetical protein BWK80_22035 [Desulfobacteraceae bacterium IS3]HAO22763.1 DUF2442 domain-containing protein [Desulfobacteraceae bacterium]
MNSAVNTQWKKAVSAEPYKDYRLHIAMENDETIDLDLTPLITSRESFWRLKNFRYFRKVAVDPLGGLCWPGGEDISPTRIFYYDPESRRDAENDVITEFYR